MPLQYQGPVNPSPEDTDAWVMRHYQVAPGTETPFPEIYAAYTAWTAGQQYHPASRPALGRHFKVPRHKRNGVMYLVAIEPRPQS
jgi:hypothetical protein